MQRVIFWIGLFLIVTNTSCAFAKLAKKKTETKKTESVMEKHDERGNVIKSDHAPEKPNENADHGEISAFAHDANVSQKKLGHEMPTHDEQDNHGKPSASAHKGPHWSYNGKTGPNKWGHLDPEYRACSSGKEQSPINITNGKTKNIGNIRFYYKPSKLNVLNNGHTIQVDYDKGSSIRIDGERYDLLQFHFHTPSEHTIEGIRYPMELHLVHKNKDGKLAVVGLMMVVGKHNNLLGPLWENLPSKERKTHEHFQEKIDMASILPPGERTFRYPGSLTTPPCSEGVKWNVLLSPISISNEQLLAFQDLFKNNSRPVQKLGKRVLWEDTTP